MNGDARTNGLTANLNEVVLQPVNTISEKVLGHKEQDNPSGNGRGLDEFLVNPGNKTQCPMI